MVVETVHLAAVFVLLLRGRRPHFLDKNAIAQPLSRAHILVSLSKTSSETTGRDFHESPSDQHGSVMAARGATLKGFEEKWIPVFPSGSAKNKFVADRAKETAVALHACKTSKSLIL
jgi:hypothetical protein